MSSGMPTYVDAFYSNGRGMAGMQYLYLRPNIECFNKSRKVGAFWKEELWDKADKVIKKWYAPGIFLYEIDGHAIASNNPENALKEYWRVCDIQKVKQKFDVVLILKQQ